MSMAGRKGALFFGWWIVTVAAVGVGLGYAPIAYATFGLFLKSLTQEFGWSRTEISLASSISLGVLSFSQPIVGRLIDRFGARRVIVPGTLLFAVTLMSFYLLTPSLVHFYALYVVLGVVGAATTPVPYSGVVSQWFDRRRGLALGLAMLGFGIGTIVLPVLANGMIDRLGWRSAYVVLGAIMAVISVPIVALFLKERPDLVGLAPDGEPVAEAAARGIAREGMERSGALRSGTFWLMSTGVFLVSAGVLGSLIHLVPMLTDRGLSSGEAAAAASLMGVAVLVGRTGAGILMDRFFAPYVAAALFFATGVGLLVLWSGLSGGIVYAGVFLVGIGWGAEVDVMAFMVSRYFGLRAFNEVYGYAFSAYMLGGVVGPLLMGMFFDALGNYEIPLGIFMLATLLAAGLMLFLGPYRLWERSGAAPATAPTGR